MKRPLEYIAGGFVLGEVLALLPLAWEMGISVIGLAGVFCLWKKNGRSFLWWLLPVFCAFGMIWLKMDLEKTQHYRQIAEGFEGQKVEIKGTVTGIQTGKEEGSLTLELSGVVIEGKAEEKEEEMPYGTVLAYVEQKNIRFFQVSGQEMEGSREAVVKIGMRVKLKGKLKPFARPGNPGEFDYGTYYHSLGIEGRFSGEKAEILKESYSRYFDCIYRLKRHAAGVFEKICTEKDKGIFQAMVLGEKTELSGEIRKLYQSNGIAHLLAISGLHISMIGMGVYKALRKTGLSFGKAGILGAGITASYGFLAAGTGISSSVARAVIMIFMQMGADYLGRTYDMRTAVSLSAIMLLFRSPSLLFQAGFQLSFGAVLALGIVVPAVETWVKAKSGFGKIFLAGAVIQIITCPIVLYHYFEYPVYGIFLNLVVIPLMSYVLISGILGIILGTFHIRLGMAAVGTGHYVLELYQWICEQVRKLPGAVLITGRPSGWQMGIYGLLWCGFLIWIGKEKKENLKEKDEKEKRELRKAVILTLFAVGNILGLMVRVPVKGMEVTFLDVGQGDGICIRTKETVILVDGGSTDKKTLGEQILKPFLKSQGISRVDYAIVSHGDQDHISGLVELLEDSGGIRICNVVLPWLGQGGEEVYGKLQRLAREHGARTAWMKRGDKIQSGDFQIKCLYAGQENMAGLAQKDRNEHSLLLQVQYGLAGILLTGDMSEEGERQWLKKGEEPEIQVLKVAHHGSSYSTGQDFLNRVSPQIAVISCGEGNRYGHPGQDTLKRLKDQGTAWYLTMDCGAVTIKSNGKKLEIKTFFSCSDKPLENLEGVEYNKGKSYLE